MLIKEINTQEFERVILTSQNLVLVEFYITASASSYLTELSLSTILKKHLNRLDVFKIDVEKNSHLPKDYSLFSFPSLLFFKNNRLVDILKGVTPRSVINKKINVLLNNCGDRNSPVMKKNELLNYN